MTDNSITPASVVIADEHEITRIGLRSLVAAGDLCQISGEATNGLDAVKQTIEICPSLLIVNAVLPLLNGIEVVRRVLGKRPQIAVVMFTEIKSERVMLDALQVGVKAFVLKSDSTSDLLQSIHTVLRGHMYFNHHLSGILQNMVRKQAGPHLLSARERQIVQLIAEGHETKVIARMLSMTIKTLDTHRHNIYKKLHIHSMAELVQYAVRDEIVHINNSPKTVLSLIRSHCDGLHDHTCYRQQART